jgi:hypothetical protein
MSSDNISTADWLPRIDFLLDFSAEDVWPLVIHWEKWIRTYHCENVSGRADEVGEIKKISKLDPEGKSTRHFFVEVVRLAPKERLVYRILLPEESDLEAASGYEIFNLFDLGGRTLVSYETVAQLVTSKVDQGALDARVHRDHAAAQNDWANKYIPELQRLLRN